MIHLRTRLPGLRCLPLNRGSEPSNPKEATELLAEALTSVIKKPDDDKPKAKEAETAKLPDFPNPETYRSWKITVREAVQQHLTNPMRPSSGYKKSMNAVAPWNSLGKSVSS